MNKSILKPILVVLLSALFLPSLFSQQSVARQWNETLLNAIRKDLARPPVQARNLFHSSVVMYDSWALFDGEAKTYLVGKTVDNFTCPFDTFPTPTDKKAAAEEAMSFAMYRLLTQRFKTSPNAVTTLNSFKNLMNFLGYDFNDTTTTYQTGSAASLGNYIGKCMLEYGYQDGANELNNYANQYYQTVNPPLVMADAGNPNLVDPNRWQRLTINGALDQNGNPIPSTQVSLSPEWGNVKPFALTAADLTVHNKNGHDYLVYHDPGPFTEIDTLNGGKATAEYKWNFSLVNSWSSHLDPTDGVNMDISPASLGNVQNYPKTIYEYHNFYNYKNGGDTGEGRTINPKTGLPYIPQVIPRGDFTRVLTQFWADGPTSETPPGHWYTILNYVSEQPGFARRFEGKGPVLDDLEWDVKTYFALGGAEHDAAITAWGMKGWYDGIRPVSALRYMGDKGQSSDPFAPSFSINGLELDPGLVELVYPGDTLAGPNNENVGKIKLYTWRGPSYITNPVLQFAGVGWILAENWWPYQRKTFVTPPFPGYISGHSTFSRAAAEMMTKLTGDEYFPKGLGEFHVAANSGFLVIEKGPSVDVTLQWATYRDASDQCSLSRIWGGIHPPMDDIPGRNAGIAISNEVFDLAKTYFYRDNDGDGYFSYEDCDDNDPNVNPGAIEICDGIDNNCSGQIDEGVLFTYYLDFDGDGYGTSELPLVSCSNVAPAGYVTDHTDCNDIDLNVHPGASEICDGLDNDCNGLIDDTQMFVYYKDNDGDGFGDISLKLDTCLSQTPVGYVLNHLDCNDNNNSVHPGAIELCDGIDNNCNGLVDDLPTFTYYIDIDGDGFGNDAVVLDTCLTIAPPGYVSDHTDCNDNDPAIHPGATEICDGIDNDCNGLVDDVQLFTYYRDIDGDGYGDDLNQLHTCLSTAPIGYVTNNGDCNDNNININPAEVEICDGIDNNCNGLIDDTQKFTYYADSDGDGFGDLTVKLDTCAATPPFGYVLSNTDCNDNNPGIHPGSSEVCDGIDNNCNGLIDDNITVYTYYRDNDGDGFGNLNIKMDTCLTPAPLGFVINSTDCDDNDNSIYPGASEVCDGKDNDCNGLEDDGLPKFTYYVDGDGDGFGNPQLKLEICWNTAPLGFVDNNADCNDSDANIHPGVTELCDGKDNDCNGEIDENLAIFTYYIDNDGDGYGNIAIPISSCYNIPPAGYVNNNLDCNDANPFINPAQPEVLNGLDDNCNGQIDESVSTSDLSSSIKIYPNPVEQLLNLDYVAGSAMEYKIVNISGVLVKKGDLKFKEKEAQIDFSLLDQGMYILYLYDANAKKQMFTKIVKIRK